MDSNNGAFEIQISDNGKGFDFSARDSGQETAAAIAGDGLSNMRKRLAEIGGLCRIESACGKGTVIWFTISLNSFAKTLPEL